MTTIFPTKISCPKQFSMSQNFFPISNQNPMSNKYFFPCLKNIFPTKNLMSQKNFSNQNPMSKEKRFSVSTKIFHAQNFFFPTKIRCLAKILQCSKKIFHVWHKQKKRNSCPTTQKKTYHHKRFPKCVPIPIKNFHTHEIGLTHSNKIFAFIKNEFVQPSLHIKFLWLQCWQNSSQSSFNNTTNYIHC